MFDYLVIGKGLMGSAAVRYLSEQSLSVAIIGPDEPENVETHDGVFASHYDQGRITRSLSKDAIWSELAARSMAQYQRLEQASGITFHAPVGCMFAVSENHHDYLEGLHQIAEARQVPIQAFDSVKAMQEVLPFLSFPCDVEAILEPAPAGYINPRDLLRAQLVIAERQGASIIRETAVGLEQNAHALTITTREGQRYQAKSVLLATGAFSNCFELLKQKLELRIKTETTLLARVSEAEVKRLTKMPSVIFELEAEGVDSFYLLPPIRYPDGQYYVKLGCNTACDAWLPDFEAMRAWMSAGDADACAGHIKKVLLEVIAGLQADKFEAKRCLITYTHHGKPYIDKLNERLFVATGGNGSSAKSSDALGQLAASLMLAGQWQDSLEADLFSVVYKA